MLYEVITDLLHLPALLSAGGVPPFREERHPPDGGGSPAGAAVPFVLAGGFAASLSPEPAGTLADAVVVGDGERVITSYSIHYTKLYDLPDARPLPRFPLGVPRRGPADPVRGLPRRGGTVITSYSIHYTKLYEAKKGVAPAPDPTRACWDARRWEAVSPWATSFGALTAPFR